MSSIKRMRRRIAGTAAFWLAFWGIGMGWLPAAKVPEPSPLPNFDRRMEEAPATPLLAARTAALARLRKQVPEIEISEDALQQAPAWVHARHGFLSGPNGQGRAISEAAQRALPANDSQRPLKAFLNDHPNVFGHDARALNQARMTRNYVTRHNGLRTVVWQQRIDDIPVFGGLLVGHITRKGELVSVTSHFVPDPDAAIQRARPRRVGGQPRPDLSAAEAIVQAAKNLGEELRVEQITPLPNSSDGDPGEQRFVAPGLLGETYARLVWLPLNRRDVRLSWEVTLKSARLNRLFRLVIDAETGEVMVRHNLTFDLSDATYRVFTSDSPTPMSPGFDEPVTNQPPLVEHALMTLSALDTNASPLGWISDGVNETRGNNVDAHLDRDYNDLPDLPRLQGSPARVFDFPLDLTQSPSVNRQAAVVQVFYWCNWMHDKLYQLGFTEEAGNFQENNFGRGGTGGDAVQADVQDGWTYNGSNFDAQEEGHPGRMQIGIFTGADPDRDAAFDAEVVLHEYTHGLTGRLVGGGNGLNTKQGQGMAEGWSDFYALALLSEPDDNIDGVYAMGAYVAYRGAAFNQNYYFGYRRYPYSTDILKNPLTFKDIDDSQASSHPGIPRSSGIDYPPSYIYSLGEFWCVTLWDMRANLIHKYGFATGNQLALQLVTDALKLTPANPTFIDARQAILDADQVNGNENFYELWAAFAKRGMGHSAVCPRSTTTTGVQEAFDIPDDLAITPLMGFVATGPVEGPFGPSTQTYTLANVSTNDVEWTASHASSWLSLSLTNGSLPAGAPATSVSITLNEAAYALPAGIYSDTVWFTNLTTAAGQMLPFILRVGQPDYFTEIFEANDNDLDYSTFTFMPDGSASYYAVCREVATNFPTDPFGGIPVNLKDDSNAAITVTGGNQVSLYGVNSTNFFIGSNGYITFGQGDNEVGQSLDAHFKLPRISGLFLDLNPEAGGTVTWNQLSNRVVVTFQAVPKYQETNGNSFQIELFFDGTIRLTYLNIAVKDGLVGLSRGTGFPANWFESDFSAYAGCLDPLVVELPDHATEGDGLLAQQGQVMLPRPLTTNVTVRLTSSDETELVPTNSVTVPAGATYATFNLWVIDDAVLDGGQEVTIQASAPGIRKGTDSMTILDNESAMLSVSVPATTTEGTGAENGVVSVSAAPAKPVAVHLATSYTDEIDVPAYVVIPAGATSVGFTITVYDDDEIDGTQVASITAHVANWIDGSGVINVQDNEDTYLRLNLPAQVHENDGVLPNAGTLRIAGTLQTNLAVGLSSDHPADLQVPAVVTIPAGQTLATFSLTILDNLQANESVPVTVAAIATGFQNAAAQITILDDEVPDAPIGPNPADLATHVPIYWNLAWNIPDRELIANGGFEAGSFVGWYKENDVRGDFYLNDGNYVPASLDGPLPPATGDYSVVSDQAQQNGWRALYQDVTIPGGAGSVALTWSHCIRNFADLYATNQQFRVEIRDQANNVQAIAFTTVPGQTPQVRFLDQSEL